MSVAVTCSEFLCFGDQLSECLKSLPKVLWLSGKKPLGAFGSTLPAGGWLLGHPLKLTKPRGGALLCPIKIDEEPFTSGGPFAGGLPTNV